MGVATGQTSSPIPSCLTSANNFRSTFFEATGVERLEHIDVDKLNEKVAMLANIFHTCGWHTAKSGDFDQVGEAYSQTKWLWVAMTMTMTMTMTKMIECR